MDWALSPKAILILVGMVLALALVPPARALVAYTLTSILQPAVVETLKHLTLWVVWIFRTLYSAHATLIRNLVRPKRAIYPDLQAELEEDRKRKLTPNL
jgi:hypothetical protein